MNGWCGDAAATFPVGKVDPDVRRLLDVTRHVLEMAIGLMAERKWWSEVAREMEAYVKKRGFSVVEAFVGHGIGRKMHEDPQVPNFAGKRTRRSGDFRLLPGLVIAVEPMVNMGTKDGALPARPLDAGDRRWPAEAHFEHTVAMTESGPQVLTAGPNGEGW